jgi:hypothetical protein
VGDGGEHVIAPGDVGQGDKDGAIRERVAHRFGHAQREPRLADAAGPGQCDQADAILPQQGRNGGPLCFPPDEPRQWPRRQREAWDPAEGWLERREWARHALAAVSHRRDLHFAGDNGD